MIENAKHFDITLEHEKKITAIEASVKSAHKRIDETNSLVSHIHELAKNVAELTKEVKSSTENNNKNTEEIKQSLKSHGKRLGETEISIIKLENALKASEKNSERIDTIEKKPGENFKQVMITVTASTIMLIVGYLFARLFNG